MKRGNVRTKADKEATALCIISLLRASCIPPNIRLALFGYPQLFFDTFRSALFPEIMTANLNGRDDRTQFHLGLDVPDVIGRCVDAIKPCQQDHIQDKTRQKWRVVRKATIPLRRITIIRGPCGNGFVNVMNKAIYGKEMQMFLQTRQVSCVLI